MDVDTAQFLLTDTGAAMLAFAQESGDDPLRLGRLLRKRFPSLPASYCAGAAEVITARRQAAGKFECADMLLVTREAVEQATGHEVARHRAVRFRNAGMVHDCCCGIGGDALALGAVSDTLQCMDRDPVRVLFCRENLRRAGLDTEVIEADISDYADCIGPQDLVFVDPSRRSGERRTVRLESMSPPMSIVLRVLGRAAGGGVKLPPALDTRELTMSGEREWISTADGLKEAVLWTGSLRRDDVTVTLLHRGCRLSGSELPEAAAGIAAPGEFLYEPDPALIRSGLLARKAAASGMWLLDPDIAYLSADERVDDPFVTGYRIIDSLPFNLKRLREVLRGLDAGPLVVKKRGFPLSPEELRRKLSLDGGTEVTVVASRIGGGHRIFIVERLD